jgi:hypothetical protein
MNLALQRAKGCKYFEPGCNGKESKMTVQAENTGEYL